MITNRNDQLSRYCDYCNRQTLHAKVQPPKTSCAGGCLLVFVVFAIAGQLGELGVFFLIGCAAFGVWYSIRNNLFSVYRCQTCGTAQKKDDSHERKGIDEMVISYRCLKCGQQLESSKQSIGHVVTCPTCAELVTVPAPPRGKS